MVMECGLCHRVFAPVDGAISALTSCIEHSGKPNFDKRSGVWWANLVSPASCTDSISAATSCLNESNFDRNSVRLLLGDYDAERKNRRVSQVPAGHMNGRSPASPSQRQSTSASLPIAFVDESTLSFLGLSTGQHVSLANRIVACLEIFPSMGHTNGNTDVKPPPFLSILLCPKQLVNVFECPAAVDVRVISPEVVEIPYVHVIQTETNGVESASTKPTETALSAKTEALTQLLRPLLLSGAFHNNQPLSFPFLHDNNKRFYLHVVGEAIRRQLELKVDCAIDSTLQVDFKKNCTVSENAPCRLTCSLEPAYRLSSKSSSQTACVLRNQASYMVDSDLTFSGFRAICGSHLFEKLLSFIRYQSEYSGALTAMGLRPPRGLLLHGAPGTGKSSLCTALADLGEVENMVQVSADRVFAKFYGDSEANLRQLFDSALKSPPSAIILDDIDTFCSTKGEAERKLVACLCSLLDNIHRLPSSVRIYVFATTSRIEAVDASLRRYGRLDREFELLPPDADARKDFLRVLLARCRHGLDDNDLQKLADSTMSFVASDLRALCSEAVLNFAANPAAELSMQNFIAVLPQIRPTIRRDVCVEVPHVRWSDIGGLEDVKSRLRQCIEWPLKNAAALQRLGIKAPRGCLLYGPPGCSKTLIAKALATESGMAFISIKGPELFSKWLGESERAVRQLFHRARQAAPAVVFFDEVDAIASSRTGNSSSSTSASERVVAQLLTELDGVQDLDRVFVLAATNRPDVLDTALIRPGRLDRLIYVPLPDLETRQKILLLQFAKTPVGEPEILAAQLAERSEYFSGAELVSMVQEAAMHALERSNMTAEKLEMVDFEYALSIVRPRTDQNCVYSDFEAAH